jgi:hypothetical protein
LVTTSPAPTVVLVHGAFDAAAIAAHGGESCASVQQPFSPSLLASRERFRETFCADAPVDTAEAMCATHRPLSLAA